MSKSILIKFIKSSILLFLILLLGFQLKTSANNSFEDTGKLTFIKEHPPKNEFLKKYASITGAVNTPGIYEISEGMRVSDLIKLAGGFTTDVDTEILSNKINLASVLKDEDHISIPFLAETNTYSGSNNIESLININTASTSELEELPGIGQVTAQKIIDYRPYSKIEDILNVPGIGESTYKRLKDLIKVTQ